ncbi:MAG: DUF5615 family PIN-like protein [Gammaproteobacteria bacterium]|nr:DUF5615 family PIN-like protein [Gammaproteobacteria bacterium]
MKLLCDEMLKGLVRWLRAAGYDTLTLADGEEDGVLLQRAENEKRLLLTRDRQLMQHRRANGRAILLECNEQYECAAELTRLLHIDWHYRPFSRCMLCNTPLQTANDEQRLMLPVDVQADELVLYCPVCDKLFWEGSHVRRMRTHLARWAGGEFLPR